MPVNVVEMPGWAESSAKFDNKQNRNMGFSFNFFGKQEVRRFNYKPRFYDPEEEERREKFGDHHKQEKKEYVPGEIVRGSLREGNYKETEDVTKNQKFLGVLTLILMFAVVFALFKYFPKLLEAMENERAKQEQVIEETPAKQPIEDDFQIEYL